MEKVFWHNNNISTEDRRKLNKHKSCVLWLTGLSASGKSTLANELDKVLYQNEIRSYVLDGDNVRRRIGEVAKLFVNAGLFTITAFISPYREDRDMVRGMFTQGEFVEIFVKCSVEECEKRDPKGLYIKASAHEIKEFTGISAPYEEAFSPEIVINTETTSIEDSVQQLVCYLRDHLYI